MKIIALTVVSLLLSVIAYASEPINDQNWERHPEVRLIRSLYSEVNAAQKSGNLTKQEKKCVLHGGSVVIRGEIYKNQKSIVRKYVVEGGSEDSREKAEYYYNERGIPRFTFRFRGAFNGTEVEERIYFDENGKHLYTNRKEKGPGYNPGGLTDSVADPKSDYADLCKE